MRFIGLFLFCLLSLSSFATTTLLLEADDYSLTVTLEAGESGPFSGAVEANTSQGLCTGSYEVDFAKNKMSIVFDGSNGPGSGGGCHNYSLDVEISLQKYQQLIAGETIEVTFWAINFYWAPRIAQVKIVDPA